MTLDDSLFAPPPEHIEDRPLTAAARLLMGGPVALVTVSHRGKANVTPIAWHMPLSTDPPLLGIAIEQSRYSADMVRHAQAFALNIPKRPLLHHVQYLGALTGERVDKFDATQMETFAASKVTAPLIVGCAAWIECEVVEVWPVGDHILFVGLPLAVQVDPESFGDRWLPAHDDDRPLQFLGGHYYTSFGRVLEARVPRDFEAPERVLRQRLAEELELTREAREKREEARERLRREIERGDLPDLEELEDELGIERDATVDLSRGLVLGEPPEERP